MALDYDPVTGLPKKKQTGLDTLSGSPGGALLSSLGGLVSNSSAATQAGRTIGAGVPGAQIPGTGGGGYNPYGGPGAIDIAGFTPNYKSLIESDPGYVQALADLRANGVADAAARRLARQRAVATFGIVPNLTGLDAQLVGGNLQDDLTPETLALAQKNTDAGLSTAARLKQANADAVRDITNALAARGALHSGEYGYQIGRQQDAYTQAQFDATQKVTDFLGDVQSGYVAGQRALEEQKRAAAAQAAQFQASLAQNQPRAAGVAQFAYVDGSGRAVYQGPDGQTYDASGNPYQPVSGYQAPQPDYVPPPPTAPPVTQTPDLSNVGWQPTTPVPTPPRPAAQRKAKPVSSAQLNLGRGLLGYGR